MKPLRIRQISESEFTVQGHGVHTAYVETVRALEARSDTQVVVNKHGEFDITHIHTVGTHALGYLLFGSGKKVISAHVIPESFIGSFVGAKHWLFLARWYLRWFYNRADLVIAVSDMTKQELIRMGVKKPIEVVYNMVDTSRYAPQPGDREKARKALGIARDAFVVIGAGQVQPRKRVDSMVDLARRHPDMTFIWVGGMPFGKVASDHARMQRMMDGAPANMIFPGIVPLEEMKRFYHAADLFFLPSDQETFGLVVVEAAAAGLPVMLRDIPDYDGTFRDFAVMATDQTFDETLVKLHPDRKLYETYQQKAHELAAKYDSRAIAEQLMSLYRRLL